ncbi:MAG: TlpA disulfide reductase family protein [Pseudomonadota bacterium]|nr:TlpA disulfide reductase family protein [Pseudomonadota bacterium]MEC9382469.1 TlpA disulfide reductase family protein [Pseudomonadota bacterium]MEC9413998.1 TlpA disulfide reductase family protein [Pseudomonadota bacterium]
MIKSKKKFIFLFIIISVCLYFILSYSINFYFNDSANFKFSEPDKLSNLSKIEFNDPEGVKYSISDFRGKVILMNLWATWCLPCRVEMPSLDNLQKEIGDENFQVIIVAVERTTYSEIEKFLNEINIKNLKNYHDPTTMLGQHVNAKGLPVTLLIDKNGSEIGRFNGPLEWDSKNVMDYLVNIKKFKD